MSIEDVVVRTHKNRWPTSPGRNQTVLLKARGDGRVLPIHFGPGVAMGDILTLQLVEKTPSSALTYDLVSRLLEAAGASLERVTLSRLDHDVFYATISIRVGEATHVVEAGPGDALNLALRAQAPIYISAGLLADKGVEPGQVFEALEAEYRQSHPPLPTPEAAEDDIEWRSIVSPDWLPPADVLDLTSGQTAA
jgi:uncharacterized protein